jgi:hypothetical protein
VSSIWTPSGEHEPEPAGGSRSAEVAGPGAGDEMSQEAYEELVRTRAELAAIPVADIVANHAVGLWQLAVPHLTPEPYPDGTPSAPRLPQAALAIDAFAALVDGLGERLEPHVEALQQALGQLRMAYVQVASGGDLGVAEIVDED